MESFSFTPEEQDILNSTKTVDDIKPTENYYLIISQILKINELASIPKNSYLYDPSQQTARMRIIRGMEDSHIAPTVENKVYYGIVLDYRLNNETLEIFIDAPPRTKIRLKHPDDLAEPNVDLDRLSSLIFYTKADDTAFKTPIIGGVCAVEFDDAYPVSTKNNYYVGMRTKTPVISVKQGAKSIQNSNNGPFTSNSAEAGGNIQLAPTSTVLKENDVLTSNPVPGGRISSPYGGRIHPKFHIPKNHAGIDIARPIPGQRELPDILSATSGKIVQVGSLPGYGNSVIIETGGKYYLYAHLSSVNVTSGANIAAGQKIGVMGNTGANSAGIHLHFEIRNTQNATFEGTEDPAIFLKNGQQIIPFLKDSKQPIPNVALNNKNNSKSGASGSKPVNRPKLLLLDFSADQSSNLSLNNNRGNKSIKVREDIYTDLLEIKKYLNIYNIPLSFNAYNINLNNKYLNPLEKVGLQISLNKHIGLNPKLDLQRDEYYIGPDYNNKIRNMYKLKIYGNAKEGQQLTNIKYKQFIKEIDIYDITETYLKSAPRIKKIFKPLIDITQIFEDYGFVQITPDKNFFLKSNFELSNWFKFYKPVKIIKGYSHKELLETVYYNNNESIWLEEDKFWDGNEFI